MRKILMCGAICFILLGLSACGNKQFMEKKTTEGLQYDTLEDGTYCISGYTGDDVDVFVPAQYNDIDVTVIGESAFKDSDIQSISGGENIHTIDSNAFYDCFMLQKFNIEGDIISIYDYAFANCKKLEKIKFSNELELLYHNCFMGCESIKEIYFPEGIEEIYDGAFKDCRSLKTVVFSETIKDIRDSAFAGCISLDTIKIPDTVRSVGQNVFDTNVKIYVEGDMTGWNTKWSGDLAEVIYANQDEVTENVNIEVGEYRTSIYDTWESGSVCVSVGEEDIEWCTQIGRFLHGIKYKYEIKGDVVYLYPDNKDERIVKIVYDEETQSFTEESTGTVFYWYSPVRPHVDYH